MDWRETLMTMWHYDCNPESVRIMYEYGKQKKDFKGVWDGNRYIPGKLFPTERFIFGALVLKFGTHNGNPLGGYIEKWNGYNLFIKQFIEKELNEAYSNYDEDWIATFDWYMEERMLNDKPIKF